MGTGGGGWHEVRDPPHSSSFKVGQPTCSYSQRSRGPSPPAKHPQCGAGTVRPRQVQCPGQRPAIAQVSASQHWPVPVFSCPVRETRPF